MPIDEKPSRNEDEYFAKLDAELIKAQRARLDQERGKSARAAHYMKCPKCGADLQEREFHHVKVDVCPECNGMWFDAGEVDMIKYVDRNAIGRFVGSLFGQKP
jgi:uncharacterized protein